MTDKAAIILPFTDIRADDLPVVGGKGANLGEMTHAGFPVPAGFCLTTQAFQRFIAAHPNPDKLYLAMNELRADDLEAVRQVGENVRQELLSTPMPAEVAEQVRRVWQKDDPQQAYAVRSSATAEDLPDASFAGQQDTYLNIIGETALLDAIKRCWASLFTDRAILYRIKNRFDHREIWLSVVVQQMVLSEKSGTMFTADPLTGHRHTILIDASLGLGEALVSGLVSPDAYRVDKRGFTIVDRQIADKQVAILPAEGGGTVQERLSDSQRAETILSDPQIIELAKLGARVEKYYQSPQDIEWALADEKLYLVQSRPITSLFPIDGLSSPDDSLHVFFSVGHQQNMTRTMSPLSLSTFPNLFPPGPLARGAATILRQSAGRLFIDITLALRHPILKRFLTAVLSQFDILIAERFHLATQRPEFKRPNKLRFSPGFLKGVFAILRKVFTSLWQSDLNGFVTQTNALIDDFIQRTGHDLRQVPIGEAQIQAMLEEIRKIPPFFLNWVPEAAAGVAATRLLPKFASRWLPPDEVEALTLGIPGNVVNEMNLMLSDLAVIARQSPALVEQFNALGDDAHLWLNKITGIEGSTPFLDSWNDFLARYGARGPSEIDIRIDRWYEDPLPVLRVIAGNIEKNVSSRDLFKAQELAREAAYAELVEHAGKGLLGGVRLRLFKRLYHVLIEVGGMREHHKFMLVRQLKEIKILLKENAFDLVSKGKLADPDDIWFISWEELGNIWRDTGKSWQDLAAQRQADLVRHQKFTPPVVITSDGEIPVAHYSMQDVPAGALVGNPVSAGMVEGVIRVIQDPAMETLQPGEILVAPFTDPGWTPLFINAAGLVMDIGGALAHGSVVAREYGIPAVVGVRDATTKLQTGQWVRVDGDRGIIEIL